MPATHRAIVLVTPALLSTADAHLETDELHGGLAQDDDGDEEDDGDRVD